MKRVRHLPLTTGPNKCLQLTRLCAALLKREAKVGSVPSPLKRI